MKKLKNIFRKYWNNIRRKIRRIFTKELSKEDKIKVLQYSLYYYNTFFDKDIYYFGLSNVIKTTLHEMFNINISYLDICDYIPEFVPEIVPPLHLKYDYWWDERYKQSRIDYLKTIITKLKND